jgi:hypothetical protein
MASAASRAMRAPLARLCWGSNRTPVAFERLVLARVQPRMVLSVRSVPVKSASVRSTSMKLASRAVQRRNFVAFNFSFTNEA